MGVLVGGSYGTMFCLGISMRMKIARQFSGGHFPGGSFIESSKSFSNSANLSTYPKHILRCKYRLFKLVQIIQHSTNHSTQLKHILHRNYKSSNVLIVVRDL